MARNALHVSKALCQSSTDVFRGIIGGVSLLLAVPCGCQPLVHPRPHQSAGAPNISPGSGHLSSITAFVDVAVVPMETDVVLSHQTVLVNDGRITAIGSLRHLVIPAGATRIDGRGKFLLPGLADMHAHLFLGVHMASRPAASGLEEVSAPEADSVAAETRLFLWLANGATTIRNMDYANEEWGRQALRLRALATTGQAWLPRIYTAGQWGPLSYLGFLGLSMPLRLDRIAAFLTAYKAEGYDFVKIHDEEPLVLDSVLAVAQRIGLPVAGHVPPPVTVEHVLAGYTSIEHALNDYLWNGRTEWDPLDTAGIGVLAAALRRAGVWNCPTQEHYDRLHYDVQYAAHPNILKVLQDSGVKLLLGTDELPWQGVITRELQEMVAMGLTPYQALLTGTRNVAVYFGTFAESGTIAVGKRADLVLLTGNPLQDVRYTAQPAGVMVGGRWLPRAEIDRRLAGLTLPTVTEGNLVAAAPVKRYWDNVVDEVLATTWPVLSRLVVADAQRTKFQALQTIHIAQRQALLDSLGTSDQYEVGTQQVFRLIAQQLGEDRRELTADQRATFDQKVTVWARRHTINGNAVVVPGVLSGASETQ